MPEGLKFCMHQSVYYVYVAAGSLRCLKVWSQLDREGPNTFSTNSHDFLTYILPSVAVFNPEMNGDSVKGKALRTCTNDTVFLRTTGRAWTRRLMAEVSPGSLRVTPNPAHSLGTLSWVAGDLRESAHHSAFIVFRFWNHLWSFLKMPTPRNLEKLD